MAAKVIAAAVALLASPTLAHNFPYVPTQILAPDQNTCYSYNPARPCDGSDVAYIFSQNDGAVSFSQLNFSSTLNADVQLKSLSDSLPFLKGQSSTTAFGATRTGNGTLLVYAGDCDGGTGQVWTYKQGGEWEKRDAEDDKNGSRSPYFLGGTLAFSSQLAPVMDQPTIYSYGGMCEQPESTADWQAAANYTKSMISIEPKAQQFNTGYTLSVASNSGPKTPIAGFTLTPLTPSMTNKSGIVTQQASYVLLGGHTKQAFINMSTAAIWNLPAESWTYVNTQPPGGGGGADLSISSRAEAVTEVESRSGHTAVLSEDGSSVIVLGGWVGDVNTPASPQLAILEMSQAYSGWKWRVPDKQPEGNGVYGHGAALLPGNVMMVYGGWAISSAASKAKRQSGGAAAPQFYNLTSGSWTSNYTNPNAPSSSKSQPNAPDEHGSPDSKKLGLGLGLGFGLAVLLVAIIIFRYWFKKYKQRRDSRDQAVRALAQDAGHFLPDDEMMERDDDPWGPGGWHTGNQDPYYNGERSLGYETLRGNRGGTMSGALPGLHIPRKPVSRQQQRGSGYVPASQRPANFVVVPGQIHPIYEDDEEDTPHMRYQNQEVQTPTSDAPSDPFQTPVATNAPIVLAAPGNRGSATPSPENGRRHDPEVQDWVYDVDVADALLARMGSRQGRGSPTRRGSNRTATRDDESRSGSNLSESARSMAESLKSRRGTHLVPLALFSGLKDGEHQKPGSSSSSSYNTARSSFGALQAEGPSLLLGRNVAPSPNFDDDPDLPPSPSKSKPRRGWLGSLRRVFSTSENTTPVSSREDMKYHNDATGGDYEPGLVGLRGELLRRKQGRQDWEGDENGPLAGETSDWDIERAVEQRLVQVMFTVPRERLRVVNADDGSEGEDEREVPVKPQSAVFVDLEKDGQISVLAAQGEKAIPPEIIAESKKLSKDHENEYNEKRHYGESPDAARLHESPPYRESPPYQEAPGYEEAVEKDNTQLEQEIRQSLRPRALHFPPPTHPPSHLPPTPPLSQLSLPPSRLVTPASQLSPPPSQLPPPPPPSQLPPTPSHARNTSQDTTHDTTFLHIDTYALEHGFSHDTDDTGRRSSGVVMEAQAVPLTRERPRTRVLQMVDSFETMSRDGSREGSPVRNTVQ